MLGRFKNPGTTWEREPVLVRDHDFKTDACGTTLRDFVDSNGRPGYFAHDLQVYDRAGQGCPRCTTRLRGSRIGQRSTFYCPRCQR